MPSHHQFKYSSIFNLNIIPQPDRTATATRNLTIPTMDLSSTITWRGAESNLFRLSSMQELVICTVLPPPGHVPKTFVAHPGELSAYLHVQAQDHEHYMRHTWPSYPLLLCSGLCSGRQFPPVVF